MRHPSAVYRIRTCASSRCLFDVAAAGFGMRIMEAVSYGCIPVIVQVSFLFFKPH